MNTFKNSFQSSLNNFQYQQHRATALPLNDTNVINQFSNNRFYKYGQRQSYDYGVGKSNNDSYYYQCSRNSTPTSHQNISINNNNIRNCSNIILNDNCQTFDPLLLTISKPVDHNVGNQYLAVTDL